MPEFQPYRPPVCEASKEPSAPRLSESERNLQSMWWSFCSSLVALVAVAVLDVFSSRAEPTYLAQLLDYPALLNRVIVPIILAGAAMSFAILFAVPVFISGNFKPTQWLFPTGIVFVWFIFGFDWTGLIVSGRPAQHYWRDPERLLWVIQALFDSGVGTALLLPPAVWIVSFLEKRTNIQEELEFQRTLETEVANCKVGFRN